MQTTAMKYQDYIESEIERKVSAIISEIKKQIYKMNESLAYSRGGVKF